MVGDLILIKSTSLKYTVRKKRESRKTSRKRDIWRTEIEVEIITGEMVEEDCLKGALG